MPKQNVAQKQSRISIPKKDEKHNRIVRTIAREDAQLIRNILKFGMESEAA